MMKATTYRSLISTIPMALLLILCVAATSHADEPSNAEPRSRFLKELKKETYTEVKAPDTAPVFRWDFANEDVHSYAYEQEVRAKADMGTAFEDEGEQSVSARGELLVKSQGDGTAELVLRNVKAKMTMDVGDGEEPKTMEQTMPPSVVQGMREDGSGSFGNSAQDMFLKMLFPLPTETLKVGESVDVPAQMPFNAMGSLLQVKGRSRITLTRYVEIMDRTCAQLDADVDISELTVPSEVEGEYKCSTKGASVFYFDVARRVFVSGTTALLMEFSVDAPIPRVSIPGEDVSDMPERAKMSMISDSLIKVSLTE